MVAGRAAPEYENRSPEALEQQARCLRVNFPSMDAIDADVAPEGACASASASSPTPQSQEASESAQPAQPASKPLTANKSGDQQAQQQQPTLNNGYIGGAAT